MCCKGHPEQASVRRLPMASVCCPHTRLSRSPDLLTSCPELRCRPRHDSRPRKGTQAAQYKDYEPFQPDPFAASRGYRRYAGQASRQDRNLRPELKLWSEDRTALYEYLTQAAEYKLSNRRFEPQDVTESTHEAEKSGKFYTAVSSIALAGALAGAASLSFPLIWSAYNSLLVAHPLLAKIAVGVVFTIAGDLIAQLSTSATASWQSMHSDAAAAAAPQESGTGEAGEGAPTSAGPAASAFSYDTPRVLRLILYSALIGTPAVHLWFQFLDNTVSPTSPTSPTAVITKVCTRHHMHRHPLS